MIIISKIKIKKQHKFGLSGRVRMKVAVFQNWKGPQIFVVWEEGNIITNVTRHEVERYKKPNRGVGKGQQKVCFTYGWG